MIDVLNSLYPHRIKRSLFRQAESCQLGIYFSASSSDISFRFSLFLIKDYSFILMSENFALNMFFNRSTQYNLF